MKVKLGSVKDLKIIKKPSKQNMGIGHFHFSDRYSVFDWGEMPDLLIGKGEALCLMGAYCFEQLEARGIPTHYRGLINEYGKNGTLKELEVSTNIMEVDLVNVFYPKKYKINDKTEYDYSQYNKKLENCLIPLEIVLVNSFLTEATILYQLPHTR